MIIMKFDGAATENPGGRLGYGYAIFKGGRIIHKGYGEIHKSRTRTCNVAEYVALIQGLKAILKHGLQDKPIYVKGDSKLIINQITGRWKTKATNLKLLKARAMKLIAQIPNIQFGYIPREQNQIADELSKKAVS